MNEKQRLDEMRRLNPVEPQANQTPAEDARISRQAPVGQTSGASFVDRIRHVESRGNINAVGPNVPGQGTAKSDMQVMDATNLAPGFGVRPAQNTSLEERARVGRDYATAMLQRYGNEAEAAAAYNWGPGTMTAGKRLVPISPRCQQRPAITWRKSPEAAQPHKANLNRQRKVRHSSRLHSTSQTHR
jgi:hypothetical protein